MPTATNPITQERLTEARRHLDAAREALKRSGADEADPAFAPVFKGIAEAQALIDAELCEHAKSTVDGDAKERRREVLKRIRGHIDTVDSLNRA